MYPLTSYVDSLSATTNDAETGVPRFTPGGDYATTQSDSPAPVDTVAEHSSYLDPGLAQEWRYGDRSGLLVRATGESVADDVCFSGWGGVLDVRWQYHH